MPVFGAGCRTGISRIDTGFLELRGGFWNSDGRFRGFGAWFRNSYIVFGALTLGLGIQTDVFGALTPGLGIQTDVFGALGLGFGTQTDVFGALGLGFGTL